MAPKRFALPPPVESSEESDTDESEEIAYSPPVAAPSNTSPPLQMVQRHEAAHDEEEEEEEDSEEEEEEGEEEEEEGKANHAAPFSAPQNPPQPPPKPEESDESGEEEEEEGADDVAPPPVSSPRQEAKQNGGTWTKEDDVRILEALAAHRREHGKLPQLKDLEAALAGTLDNAGHTRKELSRKIKSLKAFYTRNIKKADLPSKVEDRRIFDLYKEAFGDRDRPEGREFGELCKMYPYLGEVLRVIERTDPGLFKREISMIDDDTAHQFDQKIKKQRVAQMKLELRRHDLTKEVIMELMNLLD